MVYFRFFRVSGRVRIRIRVFRLMERGGGFFLIKGYVLYIVIFFL